MVLSPNSSASIKSESRFSRNKIKINKAFYHWYRNVIPLHLWKLDFVTLKFCKVKISPHRHEPWTLFILEQNND